MDFVQRNLINERNNLQVELAKAKILIAQLSEEKNIVGERLPKDPHVRQQKPSIYVKGKDGNYEPKPIPTKQQNTSPAGPESTNEQAQYISSLENAVIALAESMNMSAEELIEYEFKTPRSLKKMADIARAVSHGTHQPLGNGITPSNNLTKRAAENLRAHGVLGAHTVGDHLSPDRERIVIAKSNPNARYTNGRPPRAEFEPVGPKTPIEFNNPRMDPDEKRGALRNAQALSDRARVTRAANAEKQSRTFE